MSKKQIKIPEGILKFTIFETLTQDLEIVNENTHFVIIDVKASIGGHQITCIGKVEIKYCFHESSE